MGVQTIPDPCRLQSPLSPTLGVREPITPKQVARRLPTWCASSSEYMLVASIHLGKRASYPLRIKLNRIENNPQFKDKYYTEMCSDFEAHRLLYHSTLGLRVTKKKKFRVASADWGVNPEPSRLRRIALNFFFFFITLQPRVERCTRLCALNTSPPRNHCTFL